MPEQPDRDVYPEPPSRTPAPNHKSQIPNIVHLLAKFYDYAVDAPVTAWANFIERQHAKHRFYYYHRNFRRVPDITECFENDFVCCFEAEMQWHRDMKVEQEIVKILEKRLSACIKREGEEQFKNCSGELQKFQEASDAFQIKYGDLGAYGNGRKCLMKQKQRMIAERKAQKAAGGTTKLHVQE